MTIFSDTVTSIFVTKPEKGEKVVTIALMDSEEAKVLSDNEAIEENRWKRLKGWGTKSSKPTSIRWAASAAVPIFLNAGRRHTGCHSLLVHLPSAGAL